MNVSDQAKPWLVVLAMTLAMTLVLMLAATQADSLGE